MTGTPYVGLAERCARIDRRHTRYRFDLEADVPWDRLHAPGAHYGRSYRDALGVDTAGWDDDALARLDWALARATCHAVHDLEGLILRFTDEQREALGPTRSALLLYEEEEKHMALFARYGEHLDGLRPDLVEPFAAAFEGAAGLLGHLDHPDAYPSPAGYHYLFWINTVFFEEYTIWIDATLEHDGGIQPVWQAAHAVHRQEELQHVVTDVAHIEACNLTDAERVHYSKLFLVRLEAGFDRFFGIEAAVRVAAGEGVADRLAGRTLRDLPLFELILHDPAFRRTRACAPYLEELARRSSAAAPPAVLAGVPLAPLPADTLPGLLARTATRRPSAGLVFRGADGAELRERYGDLLGRAEVGLGGLRRAGVSAGETVLVVLPEPRELLGALWSCWLGGVVPAPLGLGLRGGVRPEDVARIGAVHRRLGEPLVVADAETRAGLPDAWRVRTWEELAADVEPCTNWCPSDPDAVAFVQHSSGSTGEPRGVELTHRNLIANACACLQHQRVTPEDVIVSFMPLHHDMGLAFHLAPLANGAEQVVLAPAAFARRPLTWLDALTAHGGTISAAPNFACAAVLRRLRSGRVDRLELGQVRSLLVGAEPISAPLLDRFQRALASAGLRRDALRPAYGLAEATCAVSMGPPGTAPRVHVLDRVLLAEQERAAPAEPGSARAAEFVSVGTPMPGCDLRIADAEGRVLALGEVGEVEVRGPCVMTGYRGDPAGTAEVLRPDGWLRTGDLGLIQAGQLVVTGRAKDVVFVNGRNYFASDLEALLEDVDGVAPGRIAVVGLTDPRTGREQVVPCVRPRGREPQQVADAVAARLADALAYPIERVLIMPPDGLARTTSGKVRRHRLRTDLLRGALDADLLSVSAPSELDDDVEELAPGPGPARLEVPAPPSPVAEGNWEGRVRAAWAAVLGRRPDEVPLDVSFFALGGDSLAAVDVHSRLEEQTGQLLDIRLLREGRTVRQQAALLRDALCRDASDEGAALPLRPRPPATPAVGQRDVAIVAAAVRLPGAPDLAAYWDLLREGRLGTGPVPGDRFDLGPLYDPKPGRPGKTVCLEGGFVDGVRSFDPEPFGMSDDEVRETDPQQRLFLEVAADALADAGCRTDRVGVFAGAGYNEYFSGTLAADPGRISPHTAPANLENMTAARVAQRLGLVGPALTVNAACATSLVAVHLACQSLLAGECEVAIAGGAELNLTPLPFVLFSQAGVLSAAGRCRPFSKDADGFVPGEGAGAVVLKPLEAALRDGDPVLAVVKGGAVNNDGGALSGLAPNPTGQRDVLQRAYAQAEVDPLSVGYVEAHGTGTRMGDPVEVRALAQVFAAAPPGTIGLGSVKSNLGHLLNAAGVASLVKVVLALRHETQPPTLGCESPDPRLDLATTPFVPVRAPRPWPRLEGAPRRAGVSAFGIGGTNCHLIVEEAPAAPQPRLRDAHLLALSAPSDAALARVAGRVAEAVTPRADLARVCAAVNARAERFPLRAARVVVDAPDAQRALGALRSGRRPPRGPKVVFLLPGPGTQAVGMGAHLLDEPAVAEALSACDRAIRPVLGRSLQGLIRQRPQGDAAPDMDRIECSQPVVFGFGLALAAWLEHLGVRPDAVIGHSAGEYGAAVLARVLPMEQAARLVTRRGLHMSRCEPGRMAAVLASEQRVRAALRGLEGVSLAALNAPDQTVISGLAEAVEAAAERLTAGGVEVRRLPIGCGAHSSLMAPASAAFADDLLDVTPHTPALPFFSSLIGARLARFGRSYWTDHLRAPVRFALAVRAALDAGYRCFVELGASSALSACVEQVVAAHAPALQDEVEVIPLLRQSVPGWRPTLEGLGRLWEAGVPVDLGRVAGAARRDPVWLAPYPYERRELWIEPAPAAARAPGAVALEERWTLDARPAVRDHRVRGSALAPAALLIDRLLAGLGDPLPVALRDVVIARPLALEAGTARRVRVREQGGAWAVESSPDGAEWASHLTATRGDPGSRPDPLDLPAIEARCAAPSGPDAVYRRLAAGGLRYGPSVRTLGDVRRGDGELLARLAPSADDPIEPHALHAGLLDGAMQSLAGLTLDVPFDGVTFLGFAIERVAVFAPLVADAVCHARLAGPLDPEAEVFRCDVTLAGAAGEVLATLDGVVLKRQAPAEDAPRFYAIEQAPLPALPAGRPLDASATWLLAGPASPLRTALEREVETAGGVALSTSLAELPGQLSGEGVRTAVVLAPELEAFSDLVEALAKGGLATLGGLVAVTGDAAVTGFVRSLDRERPGWRCRVVRPASDLGPSAVARAVRAELAGDPEQLVVDLTADGRAAPSLRALPAPPPAAADRWLTPGGLVWITGGLGGIGASVAEALATRVGARLLLTGRRADPDPAVLERIAAVGGEACYAQADVTDAAAVAAALAPARAAWGPVTAVIHAAGVLADAEVGARDPARSQAVLAPKRDGTGVVLAAVAEDRPKVVALCSSLAGLFGVPGQTDYAAANAALDAAARAAGAAAGGETSVVSVAFGPWRDVGMVRDDSYQRRFQSQGLMALGPGEGAEALLAALSAAAPVVAVARVDPPREAALLAAFNRPAAAPAARRRVAGEGPAHGFLREALAEQLRCDPDAVDCAATFRALGVDSLAAVTLVRGLERRFGLSLPRTLLFELQTPDEVAAFLVREHGEAVAAGPASTGPEVRAGDVPAYLVGDGRLVASRIAVADPGPGEVEVEVRAAGVNFIDLLAVAGAHPVIRDERFVPGHEVAGVVRRVGEGVRGVAVGDRVMALVSRGGYAARVVAPAATTFALPDGLSFAEGAAVVVTGLTAVGCVETKGRVARGERVLVQAAAGATGLACVQLALHHGAEVLGTASAPAKLARLAELGVAHPLDYSQEPFDAAVRRVTSGEGVDLVIDSLSGDAIPRGLALLRPGGRFVEIGAAGIVDVPGVDPRDLFARSLDFATVNVARLGESPARLAATSARLVELLGARVLRPEVGHVLPWSDAAEAHRLLRERRNLGKVVLEAP